MVEEREESEAEEMVLVVRVVGLGVEQLGIDSGTDLEKIEADDSQGLMVEE